MRLVVQYGYFHSLNGRWVAETKGPLYVDAYPLSDKYFLVSCNPDKPCHDVKAHGLYLLDDFGNCVLIHRDKEMSCWQPIPLRPRPKPPVLPPARTPQQKEPATLMMSDVYRGLKGVPRGTVKYLRVLETVPRPWAARRFWDGDNAFQQHAVVSLNGSLHVKRLHGIVPVEEDGSARFIVPPDKNLFFQALDENFMEVQPILDKHCVRCHNPQQPEAKLDLTGELTTLFSRSYEQLLGKGQVEVFHENDPKTGDASPIPPYTLGSHASKLVWLIREGHEDVELSRAEFIRLVTWIDANSPYYGSYFGRRNLKYRDHPDFRPVPE